jgi:hypothetical protein
MDRSIFRYKYQMVEGQIQPWIKCQLIDEQFHPYILISIVDA